MLEPQNQAQAWWLDSNLDSAKLEKVENMKRVTTLVLMQSSVSSVKPYSNQEDTTRKLGKQRV